MKNLLFLADNSSLNSSLSFDSNTVIVQVFVLATAQSGSSFDLTLSNLIPSGQSALASITSHLTAGSTQSYGNVNMFCLLLISVHKTTNFLSDFISQSIECNKLSTIQRYK